MSPQDSEGRRLRLMSITPVLNEEQRIGPIIRDLPWDRIALAVVVNDGSTDVGSAIRTGIQYALENGFEAVVVTSGSGKTRSCEAPRLIDALEGQGLDFAQGSRYVAGGWAGNMPFQRVIGTRVYSWCFSALAGRWIADASSGFRAMTTAFLKDPRIDLDQEWLDRYELEPYLLYKAITLGYRLREVPVSIEYPPPIPGVPYTRIRALVDWWRIIRPAVFLRFGLRH
jgi:dolichol-phosphate mannosyltransferase